MKSKKADRWIVSSLMAALVIESVLLLWHLGIINWQEKRLAKGQGPAGIIAKNENELRRRGINSLVWEKSHRDEVVFYYDSLLTLTQSTALLQLEQEAEVELAENTLVTIEPPEDSASGEIRLKFMRGNLQARNPFAKAHIAAPDFVVELKAGSEMQLRQTGENDFEVQIKKGEALVTGSDGRHELSDSRLLRLSHGRSETLKIDKSLRWISPPPDRTYAHAPLAQTHLRWEGEASELRLQKTGHPEQVIPLQPQQRELKLTLEPGDHLAYLRTGESTSAAQPLQLWRAPLLHLISPLPRNRVRTHEATFFLWTRAPGISQYVFKLNSPKGQQEEDKAVNSHQIRFTSEDDARWSVWGRDSQGYLIPPLYEYPLFIREEPFAPPALNAPRVRKPASEERPDKGAFFWLQNLLLPMAHADEEPRFEAVFSWQPVQGADEYWVEISESADFRSPVVSTRTSRTLFVWREFRDRKYYWRVAAGSRSGRMGVFSEPAMVSLNDGVEVRKIVVAENKVAPVPREEAPAAVVPVPLAPAEPLPEIRLHESRGLRVLWRGGFALTQAKAERNVQASLSGPKMMSFSAEADVLATRAKWWNVESKYSRSTFKPESASAYPYQRPVVIQSIEARLTRIKAASPWGFGFSVAMLPGIERQDAEEIRSVLNPIAGVHMRALFNLGAWEYQSDLGVQAGAPGYGLSTTHRLLAHPFQGRLLMGIGIEGSYLLKGSYNLLNADGFITLGFEF